MHEWDENFCHNIAYIRKINRITKKEMAEILGISVQKLNKIENMDPAICLYAKNLQNFCTRFELSADDVMGTRFGKQE